MSWPEFLHHPWRTGAALLAVMLGVALAFSVQLINQSALSEFSSAMRAVNGVPDFELRSATGSLDEALYARVAQHPLVAIASPVIELDTVAFGANGERVPLKIVGIDALVAAPLSPALLPQPRGTAGRLAMLETDTVFLSDQAERLLGAVDQVQVLTPSGRGALRVAGRIAAQGGALAVMDIAGVQQLFGRIGQLTRIDVQLRAGADRERVLRELALPAFIRAAAPDEAAQRVSNVSRAYRVNLTVLALVALFTGAFLVFSILSLSVAKRQPQLALLGVLGLTGRERLLLVITESALLGALGSLLGLALGTALAALALKLLGGDLGGGYFPGVAPRLQFDLLGAVIYGLLGIAAAVVGGWVPARAAQQLAPAQALKGLGSEGSRSAQGLSRWLGPALLLAGLALALMPPIAGIPLAAYVGVACLMLGGIVCVPFLVGGLLAFIAAPSNALALLAVERARHQRHTATIAVAGVVASLSLSVALTVMVASFRESVTQWLETLLPADLYVRTGASVDGGDLLDLPTGLPQRAATLPSVKRVDSQRLVTVQFDPARPAVALIARRLDEPDHDLPLVGDLLPLPKGATAVYVSEAMVTLYDARPGTTLKLPLAGSPDGAGHTGSPTEVFVRGVWRDYARQSGAVAIALDDYRRLTGDTRITNVALTLQPGTALAPLEAQVRSLSTQLGVDGDRLEFASSGEIRKLSLRIFDRSFAVTYWLQAVAIAIGLFGIAASFSAQVLARRKEFGLLSHLGLTRAQILVVVAAEGAVWTAAGALLGLLLGLAVSVVLVKVVNPQSFNWTMDLLLPWPRLAVLCLAVLAAGTLTAWLAARRAAGRGMALAVKEDW